MAFPPCTDARRGAMPGSKDFLPTMFVQVIFLFVSGIGFSNGYQCIEQQSYQNASVVPFRHCVPQESTVSKLNGYDCRCHGIHINRTGDNDCKSEDEDGRKWCYVIGEQSGCSDLVKSTHKFPNVLKLKTVYTSFDACHQPVTQSIGKELFVCPCVPQ